MGAEAQGRMEGTEVTPVERLRHGAKNLVVEVIILSITRSRDSRKPTMLHVADGEAKPPTSAPINKCVQEFTS